MKYIYICMYTYLFCFVLFCFVSFVQTPAGWSVPACGGSVELADHRRCRRCRGFLVPQVANWPWSGDQAQCHWCVAQNLTESVAGICVAAFLESVLLEIERTLMG